MKHKNKYIFIILFIFILWLPTLAMILKMDFSLGIPENSIRIKSFPVPVFNIRSLSEFPDLFENYYQNNHGFRNAFLYCNTLISLKYLKVAIVKNILSGKDNWLFWTGDTVIERMRTLKHLTVDELNRDKLIHEQRHFFCKKNGMRYLFVMPPNKHTIYPEYLPNWIAEVKKTSHFNQITTFLKKNTAIELVDLRTELLAEKKYNKIFFKTDTHWNDMGAFIAYKTILTKLSKSYPNIKSLTIEDFLVKPDINKVDGDLLLPFGLGGLYSDKNQDIITNHSDTVFKVAPDSFYENGGPIYPIRNLYVYENTDPDKFLKAVVFHDSTLLRLHKFLSYHFKKIVYVYNTFGNNYFDVNIIEHEKPDIVIVATGERFVYTPPDNPVEINDYKNFAQNFADFINHGKKPSDDFWEIYLDKGYGFDENKKKTVVPVFKDFDSVQFPLIISPNVKQFRIDLPAYSQLILVDSSIFFKTNDKKIKLGANDLSSNYNQLKKISRSIFLSTGSEDPYIIWKITHNESSDSKNFFYQSYVFPAFFYALKNDNQTRMMEIALENINENDLIPTFYNLWKIWKSILINAISSDLLNYLHEQTRKKWDIYWDTGTGFSEKQKLSVIPKWKDVNSLDITSELPPGIKRLRIDLPGFCQFIMQGPKLSIKQSDKKYTSSLQLLDIHHIQQFKDDIFRTEGLSDPYMTWSTSPTLNSSEKLQMTFQANIFPTLFDLISENDLGSAVTKNISNYGDMKMATLLKQVEEKYNCIGKR